jgi:hypothetical protein
MYLVRWIGQPGSGLDREGDLTEVFCVDGLIGVRACGLQNMVGGTRQGDAALFSRMTQYDATVFRIAGSVTEHRTGKDSRLARIIPLERAIGSLATISDEITTGASALRSVTR